MATKAELQAAHGRCEQIHQEAAAKLRKLDFDLAAAVKCAETALPLQHAAATFQRRFQNAEAPAIPIVDLILRYAPACFLSRSLDAVEAWYLNGAKKERSALPDILKQVAVARNLLAYAVELWAMLAESPTAVLRSAPDPRNSVLISHWLSAKVVAAHPNDSTTYFRITDPRRDAVAKCSACGGERRAPLANLLEPSRCSSCGHRTDFVIYKTGFLK
jgi:hypothetical protein